jgi:hypothetical protein
MNYGTVLVERSDKGFVVNTTKYSVTTSKIQTYIDRELGKNYPSSHVRFVNNIPMGSSSLELEVR